MVLGLWLWASAVSAQKSTFAREWVLALSAENLFGVVSSTATTESTNVFAEGTPAETVVVTETSTTSTQVALLARGRSPSPYAVPRLAFDVFVWRGLSVGGSIGYSSTSAEVETSVNDESMQNDGPSRDGWIVGPRVGYGHMFTKLLGVWPRLGLTYYSLGEEQEDGDGSTLDGWGLSAGVMVVISPAEHVALQVGPTLDLGLTGSLEQRNMNVVTTTVTELDTVITDVGLSAGLLAWF